MGPRVTSLSQRAWDKWEDVAKVPLGATLGASLVVPGSSEDPGQLVEWVLGEHRGQWLAVGGTSDQPGPALLQLLWVSDCRSG